MWHEGVIFKLEENSIFGDLKKFLSDFISNRKQRVILNGQVFTWTSVNAGVPQGSILDLLLILICINDLSNNLLSSVKLFADDASLFSICNISVFRFFDSSMSLQDN